MENKNVSQETKEEETKPQSKEEVQTVEEEVSSTKLVDDANLAAKRLEDANKETRELLEKREKLDALKVLGGGSEGGQSNEKKEETPKEYADRVMANDPTLTDGK